MIRSKEIFLVLKKFRYFFPLKLTSYQFSFLEIMKAMIQIYMSNISFTKKLNEDFCDE